MKGEGPGRKPLHNCTSLGGMGREPHLSHEELIKQFFPANHPRIMPMHVFHSSLHLLGARSGWKCNLDVWQKASRGWSGFLINSMWTSFWTSLRKEPQALGISLHFKSLKPSSASVHRNNSCEHYSKGASILKMKSNFLFANDTIWTRDFNAEIDTVTLGSKRTEVA